MVDFRYHLVSLGAVFIALAVGIILGAGPLQNSIGNVLNSQVQALSESNEKLKEESNGFKSTIAQYENAWEDLAPSLVTDTLADRSVAIIALPGVTTEEISAVTQRLADAGASINMQITLNGVWTAADQTAYRTTFASQLATYIDSADASADPNTLMADALRQLAVNGETYGQNATLRDIFTGSDHPMMTIAASSEAAAQAVVFIAPNTDQETIDKRSLENSEVQAQATYDAQTYAELAAWFSEAIPTVVAGAADSPADVARVVRDANTASTVDNLSDSLSIGSVNVVMAVASELNDSLVHLGFNEGAKAALSQRVESVLPAQSAPADSSQDAVSAESKPAS
ncbi:copper transporter [Arcanobacterium buesumense]|uniref:Copper transporter n=1 Tax=Arcanobacterium buesumense TaxID=2722751 RepID=A0A6H2EKE6_9ACTO|nr:copper transporter [Arcanobacterium buesumense]QJC21846.1 copper transporter [Arcanobacterium buesumense]